MLNSEMPIEKGPSFLGSGVVIVIGVTILVISIAQTGIAIVFAFTVVVAVTVAVSMVGRAGVVAYFAIRIVIAFLMMTAVNLHHLRTLSTIHGMDGSLSVEGGLVRVVRIFEFDSGIEQGTWSAAEVDGGKDTSSNLDPLPLVRICRIIQYSVRVEEEIEVVETNHGFFFREDAEAILLDEQVDVLHTAWTSAWNLPRHRDRHLTFLISLLSRWSKSRSALSSKCIFRTLQ